MIFKTPPHVKTCFFGLQFSYKPSKKSIFVALMLLFDIVSVAFVRKYFFRKNHFEWYHFIVFVSDILNLFSLQPCRSLKLYCCKVHNFVFCSAFRNTFMYRCSPLFRCFCEMSKIRELAWVETIEEVWKQKPRQTVVVVLWGKIAAHMASIKTV